MNGKIEVGLLKIYNAKSLISYIGGIEMVLVEKEIVLKNGVKAILKTPEISNAPELIELMKTVSGETLFLVRYEEEWENVSVKGEEDWVRNARESKNSLVIICCANGEIAGICDVTFKNGMKTSHRASVGIGIRKKYWNMGIGSAMFQELINAATEHGGIDFMELEFTKGNERARGLYQKFGFEIVCEKPKIYKLKDGTYQDLVYMQKYL
jgi:ribosomal protein S18 acetylase RimI-like enzyme